LLHDDGSIFWQGKLMRSTRLAPDMCPTQLAPCGGDLWASHRDAIAIYIDGAFSLSVSVTNAGLATTQI